MFKKLLVGILLCASLNAHAETEIEVPGLKWGSSFDQVRSWGLKNNLKEPEMSDTKKTLMFMGGYFAGREVFVFGGTGCEKYGLHSVNAIYDANESNYRNMFDNFVLLYSKKYGEPIKKYEYVKSPYHENELYSAIKAGKGSLTVYWKQGDTTILMDVTDKGRISIAYQNSTLFKQCGDDEKEKLQGEI